MHALHLIMLYLINPNLVIRKTIAAAEPIAHLKRSAGQGPILSGVVRGRGSPSSKDLCCIGLSEASSATTVQYIVRPVKFQPGFQLNGRCYLTKSDPVFFKDSNGERQKVELELSSSQTHLETPLVVFCLPQLQSMKLPPDFKYPPSVAVAFSKVPHPFTSIAPLFRFTHCFVGQKDDFGGQLKTSHFNGVWTCVPSSFDPTLALSYDKNFDLPTLESAHWLSPIPAKKLPYVSFPDEQSKDMTMYGITDFSPLNNPAVAIEKFVQAFTCYIIAERFLPVAFSKQDDYLFIGLREGGERAAIFCAKNKDLPRWLFPMVPQSIMTVGTTKNKYFTDCKPTLDVDKKLLHWRCKESSVDPVVYVMSSNAKHEHL